MNFKQATGPLLSMIWPIKNPPIIVPKARQVMLMNPIEFFSASVQSKVCIVDDRKMIKREDQKAKLIE